MRCKKCGRFSIKSHTCSDKLVGRALYLFENRYRLPEKSKKVSSQLGYILGVIFGDGWTTRKTIYLRVVDKDFADNFARVCFEWSSKKPKIYRRTYFWKNHRIKGKLVNKEKTDFIEVALCSIEASKFVRDKMNKIYQFVPKQNTEFIRNFLKGVFDSEGSYITNKKYRIKFVQLRLQPKKDLFLMKQLLIKLGYPKDKIKIYTARLRMNGKLADRFMDEIGTSIERKYKKYKKHHLLHKDGTGETTLNVSVASGATVTSTELKIAAGSDACVGSPDFGSEALAICFNVSLTGATSDWDEIRPTQYTRIIDAPDFLSGHSVINDECYILPTNAVCDYGEYRITNM